MRKKAVLTFGVFILVVLAVFWAITLLGNSPVAQVQAAGGQAPLQQVQFSSENASVTGWQVYPGQLVQPGEQQRDAPQDASAMATSPYGSLVLKLHLPDNKEYIIGFNSVEFSTRVYINGELQEEIGRVSDTESGFSPARAYVHYVVQPQDQTIEIVLQYANFYNETLNAPELYIGLPTQMFSRQAHTDFARFTIMAVYLFAFLLYFGIFLINMRGRENLFFALTCLLLAVRETFIGEQFLSTLLSGGLHLDIVFFIQFLFIGLLVVTLFSFIISLFPFTVAPKGAAVFYGCCTAFIITVIITNSRVPLPLLLVFLGIGAFIMVYIVVRLIQKFKTLKPFQMLSAGGIFALFLSLFNDILHHLNMPFGPIGRVALLQRMMLVFIFLQMVALFLQFMRIERQLGEEREKKAVLASQNEMLQLADQQRVRLLSNVSHELKTPLTVMSNYAQLALQHTEQSPQPDDYIAQKMLLVTSEAERMALMVNQILDIARIEEGRMAYQMARVEVPAMVHSVIEVYYPVLNKNHNTLQVQLQEGLPPVLADAQRISQVLVNLISNAIRFTNRGVITVAARRVGDMVHLEVSDTGVGMQPQEVAHLFERYYTHEDVNRKSTGTGLGLYISKEIVCAHDGDIQVDSRLGQGTRVCFTLPIWQDGPRPEEDGHKTLNN